MYEAWLANLLSTYLSGWPPPLVLSGQVESARHVHIWGTRLNERLRQAGGFPDFNCLQCIQKRQQLPASLFGKDKVFRVVTAGDDQKLVQTPHTDDAHAKQDSWQARLCH